MDYQHGGDIYSQEIRWDFSANVNPLGLPEGVRQAVGDAAKDCASYPDSRCRRLVGKLAAYHQVPEEWILCGNGAADLIFQAAYAQRPGEGWILSPTFSEYEQALKAVDGRIRFFALKREEGFLLEVGRLMERLGKEGGGGNLCQGNFGREAHPPVLFLCNPNNPTGLAVSRTELRKLAAFAEQEGIRLIVDECFLDFCERKRQCSMITDLQDFPHMVVVKAFTKRFGMAGLRLGYCVTKDRKLLERMESTRQPWPVSLVAQAAGEAALEEKEYLAHTDTVVRAGRKQLEKGLRDLGFWVCPSEANFILFQDLREGAEDGRLYGQCRERKLLLRSCKNFRGLDGSYYRVCVKGEKENKVLLNMLKELTNLNR